MTTTISLAALLPLLTWLATAAGAGVIASHVFDLARAQLEGRPAELLRNRAIARVVVLALACLVSIGAFALLDLISGQAVTARLDQALAGALMSQLYHLLGMASELENSAEADLVFTPAGSSRGHVGGVDADAPWFIGDFGGEDDEPVAPIWIKHIGDED